MVLQPIAQRRAVDLRRLERGEVPMVGEVRRVGATAGTNLEDTTADVWTNHLQDPRRIVLGLLELVEDVVQAVGRGGERCRRTLDRPYAREYSPLRR